MEHCAADAARLRSEVAPSVVDGSRIGPYKVVREIGHGGMGSVYFAERDDEHYHQQVAIKLINPGLNGEAIRRRFRNEMQILANLNHPNIARLFDGGETAGGVPYLVMEYVAGTPINRYCDDHDLSTEERLELFCTVCDAVQYAHQHLVIHRDIKPGNILVTGEGLPKLVDFGIAKLLSADTPADAQLTVVPFMTPEYASPEQVRGTSVTTATDVYSLGVVLYQLLSGQLPYHLKTRAPHEIAQAICDQLPERPSSRKRLHSDLDNIVLMAMRKEAERRYSTPQQLAEDIQRHLRGLPVQVPSVTAAALLLLTLVIGIAATAWQARVARAQRAQAERRFNQVRQLANSFVFEVHDAVANLPGSTPARSLIVQRGLNYLDSLAEDAANDRGLQRELAAAYEKLGAVQYTPTVAHLGDLQGALESHKKAAALREALVASDPSNRDFRRELLDSYWFIATLLGAQGDTSRELSMLREQLPARQQLAANETTDFVDRYNLAATYAYIGSLLMHTGDAQGALDNQQEAMRIREMLAGLDPNKARAQRALTISYEFLGLATDQAGDTKRALELQQRGLKMREALVAADPLNIDLRLMLNESHRYVGDLLFKSGEVEQASEHYRKQLALTREMVAADPANAQFRRNEAVALIKVGDIEAHAGRTANALANYNEALRLRRQLSAAAPQDLSLRRELDEIQIKLAK
jgi:non-specific serine/threonine protein kinase/serine/threonine-protein kinase